ncbi:MAG TPA: hypothetical protein VFU21_33170 [Kofleriaceae bacterium]|nr:hypothetical protein [Kofleriaceae bacterium]
MAVSARAALVMLLLASACGPSDGGAGGRDAALAGDGGSTDATPGVDPDIETVARVEVDLDVGGKGVAIPSDFVGFSLELTSVGAYLGRYPDQLNAVFLQLLKNLGSGILRMGGNSTDDGCWRTGSGPLPDGCTFEVSPNALAIIAAAMRDTGWRALIGVNLAEYSSTRALAFARDGIATAFSGERAGGLLGVEFGNEPNLYDYRGDRPDGYTHDQFVGEWVTYASALATDRRTAAFRMAGPAYARMSSWFAYLDDFITGATPERVDLVTAHDYPLQTCSGDDPTLAELMRRELVTDTGKRVAAWVEVAAQAGKPLLVAETNSVACRGQDGVSNVFGSALWGLDHMLTIAESGAASINLHVARDAFYDPVVSQESDADGDGTYSYAVRVLPLYYAMVMASRASGGRVAAGRVLDSELDLTAHAVERGDSVLVYLINRGDAGGTVKVTPSERAGRATLLLLDAPALDARVADVRLGDSQIDGATGELPAPDTAALDPSAGTGSYFVELPPTSAALLTIERGQP